MKKAALSLLGAGLLAVFAVLAGPAGTASAASVTIDLYATSGTTTLPDGQSVTVWGYTTDGGSITRPGGPTLTATAGDTVTIRLHNGLTEGSGLLLQGQPIAPDLTGVAAGGTTTYTFTASDPGTYLYQAALLPNAEHQVAMGLYGALVVRPATAGQAYNDAGSAYNDEAVLVLSEIDPALNGAPDRAAFDMRTFAPRYSLVNGVAHPATTAIPTTGGRKVLLRYVNAGATYHSMAVLGAQQTVIALDGNRLKYDHTYVAETFGPGQTADALVTPAVGRRARTLSVYDSSLLLHNGSTAGFGGMLTAIRVAAGTVAGADPTGPAASAGAYTPGTTPSLSATIDDTANGASNVTAAEYYRDTVGAAGSGTAMAAADGSFNTGSEGVTAPVTVPPGQHIFYVHGKNTAGNWGPFTSVLVTGADSTAPLTSGAKLAPSRSNHSNSGGVAVTATADDSATGGSAIQSAEYRIDNGTAVSMTVTPTGAPVASLDATIPAAVVNGLAEGNRVVSITSRDAAGNVSQPVTVGLVIDTTAPTTSGLSVTPSPNNGAQPVNASTPAVRVSAASLADPVSNGVNSTVAGGEVFIDTVGANGSGIPLNANDGVFSSASEAAYTDIPLTTVSLLTSGSHTLSVHAKDAAGNWGALATTPLVIDRTAPTVSGVAASPNPTAGARSVTLTATATDNVGPIAQAEWFVGADPGAGSATPMTLTGTGTNPRGLSATIDVRSFSEGVYTLWVRAKDGAGNWGPTVSTSLTVSAALQFSTAGNSNPPGVPGTADDADIYGWNGTSYNRVIDVTIPPWNLPANAAVDGFDRVNATQFYMSFSGANTTLPGPGGTSLTVQDEDVVFWNGSAWSVYFDGTAHGLGGNANLNIDAISVVGSTLYFSTAGNANPPGAGGTADDADIYSWNGTSYARVWDATTNGLAAGANVDGLVWTDATHMYLSFSATNTAVPGLGNVQDEDVVFWNGSAWSVYFNGTAHGLTSDSLDVDAFDVP